MKLVETKVIYTCFSVAVRTIFPTVFFYGLFPTLPPLPLS